jgi:hypothetical protein
MTCGDACHCRNAYGITWLHWLDGGLTDLNNAALLCHGHQTLVHDRRYIADVRATPERAWPVRWSSEAAPRTWPPRRDGNIGVISR